MGLFKGLQASKERKKAKEYYNEIPKMNAEKRELRRLKAVLGARLTAFIDKTFIEGAETISSWQETGGEGRPPATFSSAFKDVKTIGGTVTVYLPQKYTNIYFELGSKYQSALLTKNQVIASADATVAKINDHLTLENPIVPLGFLRVEDEEDEEISDE
jgi:hypothetical protein|tara:strand:+ start:304 stop:780 length:477 start_codon:yes stop_codon:yes gene_type:complete